MNQKILRLWMLLPRRPVSFQFAHYFSLLPHIVGGVVALALGPWQFIEILREPNLRLHRFMGRAYLIAVVLGSTAGLGMATVSLGGFVTNTGFDLLAGLWFLTAWFAYSRICRGDIGSHREWMIRNYALTFDAVTLRLYVPFLIIAFHVKIMQAYLTVSRLCWGAQPADRGGACKRTAEPDALDLSAAVLWQNTGTRSCEH